MGKKKTMEEFILEAKNIHGNKYDYSLVNYINAKSKVTIICIEHGAFEQRTSSHLSGNGCPRCAYIKTGRKKLLSQDELIESFNIIHGDKYDYSIMNYINKRTRVKIICPIHGSFEQKPLEHRNGSGCPKCATIISKLSKTKTTEEFIKESKDLHGNKYDYSLVDYKGNKIRVKIICTVHGMFEQTPLSHLNGYGCKVCSKSIMFSNHHEQFIISANEIHNNKYDYSLVDYKGNKNKVKIICHKHGIFEQRPDQHIQNIGCPVCRESKGEKKLRVYFDEKNLLYKTQKKFKGCKDIRELPFDFYLPRYNLCVEYDGKQHYEVNEFFGGEKGLIDRRKKDQIKNEYCHNNNIRLLRIRYNENIEEKLLQCFNSISKILR